MTWAITALAAAPASAEGVSEAARLEARDHFDRGLRLFNQLDNDGALAEFTRAYALTPHNSVLLNIAFVYSAMGRPVEAQDTFDRLLGSPSGLSASELTKVREARDRQLQRIGEIDVESQPSPATIEVDGVESGRTPLTKPLRLSQGKHIVSVLANGYLPMRKEVDVAGAQRARLMFELVATETHLAHLEVHANIPKLDLYLDGEFVGQTPLATSLA
ncbi:MAG TPA: PEGA domain-containing protein, partial [Polyangiaceae bacterium]